jgi:hypothetical protein
MIEPSYFNDRRSAMAPATRHYTVTPANADLPVVPRAIYIATDGDVVVRDGAGIDVTYPVVAGQLLQIRAVQVRTGTTATVIAWY